MTTDKITTLPNGEQVQYITHDSPQGRQWVCIGDTFCLTSNPDLAQPFTPKGALQSCMDYIAQGHTGLAICNYLPAPPAVNAAYSLHFDTENGFGTAINALYRMNFRDSQSAMDYVNRLHRPSIFGKVSVSAGSLPTALPYDKMTTEQKAAYDQRQGIRCVDRSNVATALDALDVHTPVPWPTAVRSLAA